MCRRDCALQKHFHIHSPPPSGSVDEILRYLDERFGGAPAPVIRAAPFVGQARTSYSVQGTAAAAEGAAAAGSTKGGRGGRGGAAAASRAAAAAAFTAADEAEDVDADADGEGSDDAAAFVKEAIAARAVERLIAAGHDEDGAAPGLADMVEHEAAVILSGDTDDEGADAVPPSVAAQAPSGRHGAMLASIHGKGDKRAGTATAGHPAGAAARTLALQLASTSTACAKSMMETSVAVRGQNQKAQMAAVDRFRRGEVNVLVATCIAEEGLDIGEVGLIVLYNSVRSPIRTIQRLGRTGRKTAGEAVSLCTEAEAKNFDEAFCAYRRIAQALREKQDRFKMCPCDPSE